MALKTESLKVFAMKVTADALIKATVYGCSFKDNLASSAMGNAASIGGAYGAGKIGDLPLGDGSLEKIILHAGLGGLLAEAMEGDFKSGAIAGGANEILIGLLGDKFLPNDLTPGTEEHEQAKSNLLVLSRIVGVLGAAATNGDIEIASAVSENATQYNYLEHVSEEKKFEKDMASCANDPKRCETLWNTGKFDEDSLANVKYAEDINGWMRAKMARDRVNASLDSLLAMSCQNSVCEGYKRVLVERSVNTLNYLNGVIESQAASYDRLGQMGGAAVSRGNSIAPVEGAASNRVAKGLEYLSVGAKAIPVSSYPSLAKPSPNAPSNVILGELDSLGRPTGFQQSLGRIH